MTYKKYPTILLDLDGVLADFERGFLTAWQQNYPDRAFIPLAERSVFYVRDQYPPEFKNDAKAIQAKPGFFANLPPVPGALAAIQKMREAGYQTVICSSPLSFNPASIPEKIAWIKQHFGADLARTAVFTKDKTLVRGDVLIDDRPEVTGSLKPLWKQVLFDAPYNQNSSLPRLTWENWETVLASAL